MPASDLTKSVARSLKVWGHSLGIPVRTRCGKSVQTRPQYVGIWIQCERDNDHRAPMRFLHEFPLEDRKKALTIIYGPEFVQNGSAGNIDRHSMTMYEFEWVKFFEGTAFQVQAPIAKVAAG